MTNRVSTDAIAIVTLPPVWRISSRDLVSRWLLHFAIGSPIAGAGAGFYMGSWPGLLLGLLLSLATIKFLKFRLRHVADRVWIRRDSFVIFIAGHRERISFDNVISLREHFFYEYSTILVLLKKPVRSGACFRFRHRGVVKLDLESSATPQMLYESIWGHSHNGN